MPTLTELMRQARPERKLADRQLAARLEVLSYAKSPEGRYAYRHALVEAYRRGW